MLNIHTQMDKDIQWRIQDVLPCFNIIIKNFNIQNCIHLSSIINKHYESAHHYREISHSVTQCVQRRCTPLKLYDFMWENMKKVEIWSHLPLQWKLSMKFLMSLQWKYACERSLRKDLGLLQCKRLLQTTMTKVKIL